MTALRDVTVDFVLIVDQALVIITERWRHAVPVINQHGIHFLGRLLSPLLAAEAGGLGAVVAAAPAPPVEAVPAALDLGADPDEVRALRVVVHHGLSDAGVLSVPPFLVDDSSAAEGLRECHAVSEDEKLYLELIFKDF